MVNVGISGFVPFNVLFSQLKNISALLLICSARRYILNLLLNFAFISKDRNNSQKQNLLGQRTRTF